MKRELKLLAAMLAVALISAAVTAAGLAVAFYVATSVARADAPAPLTDAETGSTNLTMSLYAYYRCGDLGVRLDAAAAARMRAHADENLPAGYLGNAEYLAIRDKVLAEARRMPPPVRCAHFGAVFRAYYDAAMAKGS